PPPPPAIGGGFPPEFRPPNVGGIPGWIPIISEVNGIITVNWGNGIIWEIGPGGLRTLEPASGKPRAELAGNANGTLTIVSAETINVAGLDTFLLGALTSAYENHSEPIVFLFTDSDLDTRNGADKFLLSSAAKNYVFNSMILTSQFNNLSGGIGAFNSFISANSITAPVVVYYGGNYLSYDNVDPANVVPGIMANIINTPNLWISNGVASSKDNTLIISGPDGDLALDRSALLGSISSTDNSLTVKANRQTYQDSFVYGKNVTLKKVGSNRPEIGFTGNGTGFMASQMTLESDWVNTNADNPPHVVFNAISPVSVWNFTWPYASPNMPGAEFQKDGVKLAYSAISPSVVNFTAAHTRPSGDLLRGNSLFFVCDEVKKVCSGSSGEVSFSASCASGTAKLVCIREGKIRALNNPSDKEIITDNEAEYMEWVLGTPGVIGLSGIRTELRLNTSASPRKTIVFPNGINYNFTSATASSVFLHMLGVNLLDSPQAIQIDGLARAVLGLNNTTTIQAGRASAINVNTLDYFANGELKTTPSTGSLNVQACQLIVPSGVSAKATSGVIGALFKAPNPKPSGLVLSGMTYTPTNCAVSPLPLDVVDVSGALTTECEIYGGSCIASGFACSAGTSPVGLSCGTGKTCCITTNIAQNACEQAGGTCRGFSCMSGEIQDTALDCSSPFGFGGTNQVCCKANVPDMRVSVSMAQNNVQAGTNAVAQIVFRYNSSQYSANAAV
ncbi:MAG: hypothetical protein HY917_05415, partial [Candidatus Diapherotrites archaeon]|nr:hypothetical protein [Candidatus Diapherotrites archaeon]